MILEKVWMAGMDAVSGQARVTIHVLDTAQHELLHTRISTNYYMDQQKVLHTWINRIGNP